MSVKYNIFLPLGDTTELKNRVVTVNGTKNTVSPEAAFFRTEAFNKGTPLTITYYNVYLDGEESGESPPIELTAGAEPPETINSFFAKLCTPAPVVEEQVVVEVEPTPPPAPPEPEPAVEPAIPPLLG
jgi:hypothetical protein